MIFEWKLPFRSELEERLKSLQIAYEKLLKNSDSPDSLAYKALFQVVRWPIVRVDSNLKILEFNEAFQKLFTEASQLSRPTHRFIVEGFRNSDFIDFLLKYGPSRDSKKKRFSFTIADKNRVFSTQVHSVPGDPASFFIVFEERTRDVELQEKFKHIFIDIAHELRNPLSSLKALVESLENSKDFKGALVKTQSMTDRIVKIVNGLLDLSRIESFPTRQLEKETFSAELLTENALETLQSKMAQKEIKLTCDYQVEAVYGNYDLLMQVIENLAENAIKYSPGQTELKLSWISAGDEIQFFIKDQGIGIPLEQQKFIFDRFYRTDSSRSREEGGIGLGLSLVKEIVLKHAGRIEVESVPGQGSTFKVSLPADRR